MVTTTNRLQLPKSRLPLFAAVAAAFWLGGSNVYAAGNVQLTNAVFQEVEVKGSDGKVEHKTVPASHVVPGTEVFYVITYKNAGEQPAEKVAVTNPLPKDLEYVSAIRPGPSEQVSVDGGKNFADLTALTVPGADGNQRAAKPSDVTHVRWQLASALKPGEIGNLSFRAKLK